MRRAGPHRTARRDLRALSDAHARELLARFAPIIEGAVRAFTSWGAHVSLEPDDLRQLARVAVLDAAVAHRDGGASLKRWVRQSVRWRLTEHLERSVRPEDPLEAPEKVFNGQDPEELVARLRSVRWVRDAIDGLPVPRQRTIMACRLQGEGFREIARTLGISPTRVHQEAQLALEVLRERATHDRLDEE